MIERGRPLGRLAPLDLLLDDVGQLLGVDRAGRRRHLRFAAVGLPAPFCGASPPSRPEAPAVPPAPVPPPGPFVPGTARQPLREPGRQRNG